MKVLFVDNKITGHHIAYAKKLSSSNLITPIFCLPQECLELNGLQRITKSNPADFWSYLKWIIEVARIANENKVDCVHFLYGDSLLKGFGIGLSILKKYNVICTFHQIRRSSLRDLSRKIIFRKINYGVVHTKKIKKTLQESNIQNVKHIEYPKFNDLITVDQKKARDYFSIPNDVFTFVALGGTRRDKGLDILLESLNNVEYQFHLLIAGKEEDFTKEFIEKKISRYNEKVTIYLSFLSEEELNLAIFASDAVILPYRKIFNGASGPLVEGVWRKKIILGPNHGSLGEIIEINNLGLTFESENIQDLSEKIIDIIKLRVHWNSTAEKYRRSIDPEYFLKKYEQLYKLNYKREELNCDN